MSRILHLLRRMRFCAFLIAYFFVISVNADDLYSPSWRGFDGSTYAMWDFNKDSIAPTFDEGFNSDRRTYICAGPAAGHNWISELDGAEGVWSLSGKIYVGVDNQSESALRKEIQIQLIWKSKVEAADPVVSVRDNEGVYMCDIDPLVVKAFPDNSLWMYSVYTIGWPSSPAWEGIKISGSVYVDQLVVDTNCVKKTVPEPSTYCILTAGMIFLCKVRK